MIQVSRGVSALIEILILSPVIEDMDRADGVGAIIMKSRRMK